MYVCMHACMYVCMYVCMYLCMYVWMHACMHACISIYIYMYLFIYLFIYLESHLSIPGAYTRSPDQARRSQRRRLGRCATAASSQSRLRPRKLRRRGLFKVEKRENYFKIRIGLGVFFCHVIMIRSPKDMIGLFMVQDVRVWGLWLWVFFGLWSLG